MQMCVNYLLRYLQYGAMARLTLMGYILILLSSRSLINYMSPPALPAQGIRVRMHDMENGYVDRHIANARA